MQSLFYVFLSLEEKRSDDKRKRGAPEEGIKWCRASPSSKFKFPYVQWGEGDFLTFDPESKSAKTKFPYIWLGGGVGRLTFHF